jgi:hypothetical protein
VQSSCIQENGSNRGFGPRQWHSDCITISRSVPMPDTKSPDEAAKVDLGFQRILSLASCVCERYLGVPKDQTTKQQSLVTQEEEES